MQLRKLVFDSQAIEFSPTAVDCSKSNIYTLLVGENGCGKSRALQRICVLAISNAISLHPNRSHFRLNDLIEYSERQESPSLDERGTIEFINNGNQFKISVTQEVAIPGHIRIENIPPELRDQVIEAIQQRYFGHNPRTLQRTENNVLTEETAPFKVIAVSSSPFDKFPILDRHRVGGMRAMEDYYVYRGARTKDRRQKSYLKSKFDQLGASFIRLFLRQKDENSNIAPLFDYLGIRTSFTLYLNFPDHAFEFPSKKEGNGRSISETVRSVRFFKDLEHDESITSEEESKIKSALDAVASHYFPKSENISFRSNHFFTLDLDLDEVRPSDPTLLDHIYTLVEYDLVELSNIEFQKKSYNSKYLLTDASSGELCILFNISSIAGSITNNALVLLDEPELSLHPKWQEEFLPLLRAVFENYESCHFVIATHSPHITSSLPRRNSYVVNLENHPSIATHGSYFSHRSADFQLSNAFNYAGHRNEYIITQVIDALTSLQEKEVITQEMLDKYIKLLELRQVIPTGDPALKLLSTLENAIQVLRQNA